MLSEGKSRFLKRS